MYIVFKPKDKILNEELKRGMKEFLNVFPIIAFARNLDCYSRIRASHFTYLYMYHFLGEADCSLKELGLACSVNCFLFSTY